MKNLFQYLFIIKLGMLLLPNTSFSYTPEVLKETKRLHRALDIKCSDLGVRIQRPETFESIQGLPEDLALCFPLKLQEEFPNASKFEYGMRGPKDETVYVITRQDMLHFESRGKQREDLMQLFEYWISSYQNVNHSKDAKFIISPHRSNFQGYNAFEAIMQRVSVKYDKSEVPIVERLIYLHWGSEIIRISHRHKFSEAPSIKLEDVVQILSKATSDALSRN